jgi:hypothetical protein
MVTRMNFEQLKRNKGYVIKLVPPACHIDPSGDPLPALNEDWTIDEITAEHVEISATSGHRHRLAKDHVRNFTTDAHSSTDSVRRGFLTLHVQIFVEGEEVWVLPNERPGAAVIPPIDRARCARVVLAAELERCFRRQIQILGRVLPNVAYPVVPGDCHDGLGENLEGR